MHPTSSFFGKCTTVLVGAALSWVTMTNRDVDQLASQLFGRVSAGSMPLAPLASGSLAAMPESHDAVANQDETEQIAEISQMLKDLGATYLRVEKLAHAGETWFRVRCDLDRGPHQVKCCLEATRDSALAAMQDVLQAADPQT